MAAFFAALLASLSLLACSSSSPAAGAAGEAGSAGQGDAGPGGAGVGLSGAGGAGQGGAGLGSAGGAAGCSAGATRACGEQAGVKWPRLGDDGRPVGECRRAEQRCEQGQWGPCLPQVLPSAEVCDGLDNDCDGLFDNDASDAPLWLPDRDGDGFAEASFEPLASCKNPGLSLFFCGGQETLCEGHWKPAASLLPGDCDDLAPHIHPGAWDGPPFPSRPSGVVPPGFEASFVACEGGSCASAADPFASPLLWRVDTSVRYGALSPSGQIEGHEGAFDPVLPRDIAGRWVGQVIAEQGGAFSFSVAASGGVRLWVGGSLILDEWAPQAASMRQGAPAQLEAGKPSPLRLEWFDDGSPASVVLLWEGPGVERQALSVVLAPEGGPRPDRCDFVDDDCNGDDDDGRVTTGDGSALALACGGDCEPSSTDFSESNLRACHRAPSSGVGACLAGVQRCGLDGRLGSYCAGERFPSAEVCDGLDNDCDGQIDGAVCACDPAQGPSVSCGKCGQGSAPCLPGGAVGPCDDPDARLGEPCDVADLCAGVWACGQVCDKTKLCAPGEVEQSGTRCSYPVVRRCEPGVCSLEGAAFQIKSTIVSSLRSSPENIVLNGALSNVEGELKYVPLADTKVIQYTPASKIDTPYAFSLPVFTVPGLFAVGAAGWMPKVPSNTDGTEVRLCLYEESGGVVEIDGEKACKSQMFYSGLWDIQFLVPLLSPRCVEGQRVQVGVEKGAGPTGENLDGAITISEFRLVCVSGSCLEGGDVSGL